VPCRSQADEATQSTKTLTQASREVVGCKGLVMLCSSLLEAVVAVNKGELSRAACYRHA
jgi:hypothetical protein